MNIECRNSCQNRVKKLEMEMRVMEDTEIATDITPSLLPLTFALHNNNLQTHCSSCFSLLPSSPIHITPLLYCSPPCSAAHTFLLRLHHPALSHSSDLRAALLLLSRHRPSATSSRIAGLLSNRHKLTRHHLSDEVSETIRTGTRALATAITDLRGELAPNDAVLDEAECALCAVLTNAVEVQDKEGRALGIAVYGPAFSWINHSCSPNACYRFILNPPPPSQESKLRISPSFIRSSPDSQIDSGVCSITNQFQKEEEEQGYGPRLIVRSIKRIKKGQEVTIAYTDLLQSKAMRQSDLWSKYRFICCCERCSVVPFTYVDHVLQEISVSGGDFACSSSNYNLIKDTAERRLTDSVDDAISEYLVAGDPESCCEKLEKIPMQGLLDELDNIEETSHYKFMLHPLHYLSLNAYTTLASAYKFRASDILSTNSEIDQNQLEAFDMSRTSAAYSLLLATATHHLFNSESSLIASLANFWTGAGESLLYLARSSEWIKFVKSSLVASSVAKVKCSKCSLMDKFRACMCNGKIKNDDFENVSNEFLDCISNDATQKVWSFLIIGCHFLRSINNPIDSGWLVSTRSSRTTVDPGALAMKKSEPCEEQTCNDNTRIQIFQLGVHCLAYGGLLAAICYGHHSHLASYVEQILDDEE
ncbi:hypothetical protein PIB30_046690 [Stylosanthes scabra]|uniref:SET domain-containing protein n=1 Tax=Stylosanthes scabra TaxID=79078 RepID=A0ABU6UGR3_9FABA|nr:hypothetical protein [Stylosanthes scabra]